jgi:phosphoserine phosphatase
VQSTEATERGLTVRDMEVILAVTSKLAAPFDLTTMLSEVVNAAKQVLHADRGSVWLYDAASDELVLEIATGIAPVRVPASAGIVGACAHDGRIINVGDCYGDERFNRDVDRASGYRTRCMLALPLIDHKNVLVGVMQVLNKAGGVFDDDDESSRGRSAAQCAVALQRVRMTEALIEGEKMRQELEVARAVQMSTLPSVMPVRAGIRRLRHVAPGEPDGRRHLRSRAVGAGTARCAGRRDGSRHRTGAFGDADARDAAHGVSLGADLDTAFLQVNNQLAATISDDRFITAFIGIIDGSTHRLRFHSGGQAPILHYRASSGLCERHNPTSFPLAAMPLSKLRPPVTVDLEPGDVLALLSDGIYEYADRRNELFGEERVESIIRAHSAGSMADLSSALLSGVEAFAQGTPQEDDITIVLVKRRLRT